jgi:M6 family metalloprotease-like protein
MAVSMMAVPAKREALKVVQPDGTTVTIMLHGDEWLSFNTTSDGYSVVKNQQGYYVYARLNQQGRLEATDVVAHDADGRQAKELTYLRTTKKYLMPKMTEQAAAMKRLQQQRQRAIQAERRAAPFDFNKFKGLVILVEFNDKKFSREDFPAIASDLFNKEGFTGFDDEVYSGSVRDYFHDNSCGVFTPQFDIYGPYTIDYSQHTPQKSNNMDGVLQAAIDAADPDVDYSQYDFDGNGAVNMVYFLFAGYGSHYIGNDSTLVWPHRFIVYDRKNNKPVIRDGVYLWDYACSVELEGRQTDVQAQLCGIGTICHEFGHVLGLPDFYDTDYEGSGGQSNDPGDWSVMAGGSFLNNGRTPAGYSLYERYLVGFTNKLDSLTETGDHTLEPLNLHQKGYLLTTPEEKEFFLLENRQKTYKWDSYLPGEGMLVYRVDHTNEEVWSMESANGNKVNVAPAHNYYVLLQAGGERFYTDGTYARVGSDPFPGECDVHELTNSTSPANLKTWAGLPCDYELTNIQRAADATITFTATSNAEAPYVYATQFNTYQDSSTGEEKTFFGEYIVGDGQFVSTDEEGEIFNSFFRNPTELGKRKNYCVLPDDVLAHSAESQALTISFWVRAQEDANPQYYAYSPLFTAYTQKQSPNSWPMMACQYRGTLQVYCNGSCDYTDQLNVAGTNTIYSNSKDWLADKKWHYYTAVFEGENAKVFFDGALKNEWNANVDYQGNPVSNTQKGLFADGKELKYICLGGNQAWDWNDADAPFDFACLRITNVALTPAEIWSQMEADFGDHNLDYYLTSISPISNVATSPAAPLFNLAGQRVSDSYKGLVIQNRHKMLKK